MSLWKCTGRLRVSPSEESGKKCSRLINTQTEMDPIHSQNKPILTNQQQTGGGGGEARGILENNRDLLLTRQTTHDLYVKDLCQILFLHMQICTSRLVRTDEAVWQTAPVFHPVQSTSLLASR